MPNLLTTVTFILSDDMETQVDFIDCTIMIIPEGEEDQGDLVIIDDTETNIRTFPNGTWSSVEIEVTA